MEQPCYKCGQAVEEGIPFCPHCSAPQIRVVITEPAPSPAEVATLAPTADGATILSIPQSGTQLPFHWAQVLKWCALAAILSFLLAWLNLLIAIFAAGFLSVVFLRRRLQHRPSSGLAGAGIGAVAGFFFFTFMTGIIALVSAFPDFRSRFRELFIEYVQKVAASRPAETQLQTLVEQLKTPEGFTIVMIAFGFLLLVFAPLIASIGGAVAGALFGRRSKL